MNGKCNKCEKEVNIDELYYCVVCDTYVCKDCAEEMFEYTCVCKDCGCRILGLHGMADDLRDIDKEYDRLDEKEEEIINIMKYHVSERK